MANIEDFTCDNGGCYSVGVVITLTPTDLAYILCWDNYLEMADTVVRLDRKGEDNVNRIKNLIVAHAQEIVDDFEQWGETLQAEEGEYNFTTPIGQLQRLFMALERAYGDA